MSVRRTLGNASYAQLLLTGGLLLLMAGAASGQTLTSAQVEAKVSAALLGDPDALQSAILGILESVPLDEAGQTATTILAAAEQATVVQKTAIGDVLATYVFTLDNEGHHEAAREVVIAVESGVAPYDREDPRAFPARSASLATSLGITLPIGPVPGSITPQLTSPAE